MKNACGRLTRMKVVRKKEMTDDRAAWISISVREPPDRELVYARAKRGTPQKVVFYATPRRWIGANIVYQFEYFREWAPAGEQSMKKSA
jgi:hypothetical protein